MTKTSGYSQRQQEVIAEFRANGGKVGGYFVGLPLLLLTTTGARSGQPRITALTYLADGRRYVVFAADGGAPRNPDWYRNLIADPEVTVEVGVETFKATATIITGEEREALYEWFIVLQPQLAFYQERTSRQIPAVAFTRREDRPAAP